MRIEAAININVDVSVVYGSFCNLDFWLQTLPDVLAIETLYADLLHQEFKMTVQRPGGPETVRGIWFCAPNERIDLCQPIPPPGFKRMTGSWIFNKSNQATTVNVIREFDFLEDIEKQADAAILKSNNIRRYLTTNLQLFKTAIEIMYAA